MLSNVDRELLQRCLSRSQGGWDDFVGRYLGLVVHVVDHTALVRSIPLSPETREDLVSDVFYALLKNDFAVLRRFREESSLATYLTVIARRIVVRGLIQRRLTQAREKTDGHPVEVADQGAVPSLSTDNREELEAALGRLSPEEAMAVRMFHLEGRTYREIGDRIGLAENSIGPYLSRARAKMKPHVAPRDE